MNNISFLGILILVLLFVAGVVTSKARAKIYDTPPKKKYKFKIYGIHSLNGLEVIGESHIDYQDAFYRLFRKKDYIESNNKIYPMNQIIRIDYLGEVE